MVAIKKDELVKLEEKYGLEEDGLTYQLRCSRITAYQKGEGESWSPPQNEPRKVTVATATREVPIIPKGTFREDMFSAVRKHPLYGKPILISPLMKGNVNRSIAYDEELGPEMEVVELDAGEELNKKGDNSSEKLVVDYEILGISKTKTVTAQATLPKVNTEITYTIQEGYLPGVPIVRGADGKRGYLWNMERRLAQVEDCMIEMMGLRQLLSRTPGWAGIIRNFDNKKEEYRNVMVYIDAVTYTADIYKTHQIIDDWRRKKQVDAKAGLI